MPITRANVNTDVDDKIRNKTALDKVDNVEDADNRDLILDYVDQQTIVKTVKTTITSAQILDLFTTPITVLDNPETDLVKIPIGCFVLRKTGIAYYTSSYFFNLVNDIGTNSAQFSSNIIGNTSECFVQVSFGLATQSTAQSKANFYKLKANAVNPITGTGDIDVYINYIEIAI